MSEPKETEKKSEFKAKSETAFGQETGHVNKPSVKAEKV